MILPSYSIERILNPLACHCFGCGVGAMLRYLSKRNVPIFIGMYPFRFHILPPLFLYYTVDDTKKHSSQEIWGP